MAFIDLCTNREFSWDLDPSKKCLKTNNASVELMMLVFLCIKTKFRKYDVLTS